MCAGYGLEVRNAYLLVQVRKVLNDIEWYIWGRNRTSALNGIEFGICEGIDLEILNLEYMSLMLCVELFVCIQNLDLYSKFRISTSISSQIPNAIQFNSLAVFFPKYTRGF